MMLVYTTVPTRKTADKIADNLLKRHLAGCVNVWKIGSRYWWKDKIEKGNEYAMLIKTRPTLEKSVVETIEGLHPYDTPTIARWSTEVNDGYENWLSYVTHTRDGPAVTVGAIIERRVNGKKMILLMKSPKWYNKWVVPGGHIEVGERAEETVVREVKEETNLNVKPKKLLIVQQGIFDKEFWKARHFIFMDYLCEYKRGKVKLNWEGTEWKWVEPRKALKMDLDKYTRNVILKYLNNEQ